MLKLYRYFYIAAVFLFAFSSCTVEKRHYRSGFYCEGREHAKKQPGSSAIAQPVNTETAACREQTGYPQQKSRAVQCDSLSVAQQAILKSPVQPATQLPVHASVSLPGSVPVWTAHHAASRPAVTDDNGEKPKAKRWTLIGFFLSLFGIFFSIAVGIIVADLAALLFAAVFVLLAILFGVLAFISRGDAREKAAAENKKDGEPVKKRNVSLGVLIWGGIFLLTGIMTLALPGLLLLILAGILPLLIVGIIQLVKNKKAGDKQREIKRVFVGLLFGLIGLTIGILMNKGGFG